MTKKRGRPSSYSQANADLICKRMSEGESLLQICKDKNTPFNQAMVFRWLEKECLFRESYARARESLLEHWAQEIISLPDNANPADANLIRIQVDARKWVLSKLLPKKYGDRIVVDQTVEITDKSPKDSVLEDIAGIAGRLSNPKPVTSSLPAILEGKTKH
jgi:hypothetical protein